MAPYPLVDPQRLPGAAQPCSSPFRGQSHPLRASLFSGGAPASSDASQIGASLASFSSPLFSIQDQDFFGRDPEDRSKS